MALRNAILASLLEGEASGYDLAKAFHVSVANFWMATPQQLYRELDRLEAEGLVEARLVEQERRPNKRLFRLTDAGLDALREFTSAPTRPSVIRDELLVQVQASDVGDRAAVLASIREKLALSHKRLARYERIRAYLLDGRPEDEHLANAPRVGPYLTLLRGISFEEDNVRWCERAIEVLERRASASASAAASG